MESLAELISLQSGVLSRRQALECALTDNDIERRLRRREWARVHPGVYVDHTGALTWVQRAWAAVLFSWPAALSHDSALRAAEGPGRGKDEEERIHVVVERSRNLVAPPGVRIHRGVGFGDRVQWNRSPPRVRYEEAALDVAATAPDEFAAIAVLAQGSCSVLEIGYVRLVERGHGLPDASRQEVGHGRIGRTYRDVSYQPPLDLELDGRLFHDSAEGRDRDFDRDLLGLVGGRVTARLSWGQVYGRPCWTAGQVGRPLIGTRRRRRPTERGGPGTGQGRTPGCPAL